MRLAFIPVLFMSLAFIPKKEKVMETFVYDQENVLSAEEIMRLDTLFRGHEERTSNEIALLTTNSYHGQPDLRSYAATCGDSLRVGKKRKNNGLIIVLSKGLREVNIAPGLGLEKALPEFRCQKYIDSLMIPLFKEDMFFDGVWQGSTALVSYLEQPENIIN